MTRSPEDSQAGPAPVGGLGGVPVEVAPGRQTAEAPPRASRGPVPGCVEPGTAAPSPAPLGDGAALSPLPDAITHPDASGSGSKGLSGQAFRDAMRQALSGNAKARRSRRGKHRADPGQGPGMIRRQSR